MCSATGSGHVITCTARRWVVSGRLYCFQRPPAEGRREACKPSTDPTSRITNVRINRTAAHRSIFSFDVFSALPSSNRLDVQKVRHRRFAIGRTKNPAEGVACIFFAAPPRPVLTKNPVNFSAQPAASRHRQDEKSCSFFQPGIRQIGSTYRKYAIAALPSAGRKITPPRRTGSAP